MFQPLSLCIRDETYDSSLVLTLLHLSLALDLVKASSHWAFVPCIPSISLLTLNVGEVYDSFTWEQEGRSPGE